MDGNRVSVQKMLYICLSLSLSLAAVKPLRSSNKTGVYTPVKQQSVRTMTSLIGANHRLIGPRIVNTSDSKSKITSSSSPGDNLYYYSPETYGKTRHKTQKTGSFASLYPSSSSTTSTTTTTPTPKLSDNRFGGIGFSESAPEPHSTPYKSNYMQSSVQYMTKDLIEAQEPNYYDSNEEMSKKYYPNRNEQKQYSTKAVANTPITSYKTNDEILNFGHNVEPHYQRGDNVRYPPKYYDSTGTGAYYPPVHGFQIGSQNGFRNGFQNEVQNGFQSESEDPLSSGIEDSSGTDSERKTGTWLGPGIAGLIIGIVPIATLIASMIPAFVSVPVMSTSAFSRRKRQISNFIILDFNSTQLNLEVLNIISRYGMSLLEEPKCLKEMFCIFTAEGRDGKNSNTNLVQNILYNIIEWTPNKWAKSLGMNTLFKTIKTNKCQSIYKCMSRKIRFKETENIINN